MGQKKSISYKGIAASAGKYYGKSLKVISRDHIILQIHIQDKEIDYEIKRFLKGLANTKSNIESTIHNLKDLKEDLKEILSSQIIMLDDPMLKEEVISRIQNHKENAPLALFYVIERISNTLSSLDDVYLRERASDVRDIGKRLEDQLLGKDSDLKVLGSIKEEVIIVTEELTPSQMIKMNKTFVRGVITEKGGSTGHMAILAKYYQIPTVVGLKGIIHEITEDEFVLVDGDSGIVIRNPETNQIKYLGQAVDINKKPSEPDNRKAVTFDKVRIKLKVNLENEDDCDKILNLGTDGIGLFRTEVLFLTHPEKDPSEDEQFLIYKKIASRLKKSPIYLRTFDLGADKFEVNHKEDNPFLGKRGIRYCLSKKDWFKKQLRAILRASVFGNIYVMLPMVTNVGEIVVTKELIKECKIELSKKRIKFKNVKLGIMVETPSVAVAIDQYVKHCDFFSIGTNDLLQYLMAVDRNSPDVSDLYNPYHISFLRILKIIIQTANIYKIPIGMCGEIASDTNFTILLIGMGLREFSVALPMVRKIKNIIRSIDIPHAQKLHKAVVQLAEQDKFTEIRAYLFNDHMHDDKKEEKNEF